MINISRFIVAISYVSAISREGFYCVTCCSDVFAGTGGGKEEAEMLLDTRRIIQNSLADSEMSATW